MAVETPTVNAGWQAPDFRLPDVDGSPKTLADVRGERGTVIAFICNHCPYVRAILNPFVQDVRELQAAGIGVAAIMSNDFTAYPDDAPKRMAEAAAQRRFTFPYLLDESQAVAKAYGAVCTPDFFGFDADLKLRYRGRFDASGREPAPGSPRDLKAAMLAVAETGDYAGPQHPSHGCGIKWKPGNEPA